MLDGALQLDTVKVHIAPASKANDAANASYAQDTELTGAAGMRLF
jgi:hypothetical protein